jgi:hypothetical protein
MMKLIIKATLKYLAHLYSLLRIIDMEFDPE